VSLVGLATVVVLKTLVKGSLRGHCSSILQKVSDMLVDCCFCSDVYSDPAPPFACFCFLSSSQFEDDCVTGGSSKCCGVTAGQVGQHQIHSGGSSATTKMEEPK
jgi:hypothetical protein